MLNRLFKTITMFNIKKLCIVVSFIFPFLIRFASAQPRAYNQDEIIKIPGITADNQIYSLNVSQKQTSIVYLDGLGRPVQSIAKQASPLQYDLIQPISYDNLGRQTISYLPYADESTNPSGSYRYNAINTDQQSFYNNSSQYLVAKDAAPYSQAVFENSPLQRLLQAGKVGSIYQPGVTGNHTKSVIYRPNSNASDGNIIQWNVDGSFTNGTYYSDNKLSVTDGKDEDNVETLSFIDLAGHIILKRQLLSSGNLDTYYIYNNSGMISYIVPPKAVTLLSANSYNLNSVPLSNLIFKFVYDNPRGRLVQKTVPGKGAVYIVYDPLNRPVLLQDANMRVNNNWNYIKYDAQGRAISQGIYYDGTYTNINSMQNYVAGLNYSTNWYEQRSSAGSTTGYYTDNVFPTTGITPLCYSYFDDYDLLRNGSPFVYGSKGLPGEIGATTAPTKGAPTMVWSTTVGSGLSGIWLLKVTFYDKRGNSIQTLSNNHIYNTGSATLTDTTTTLADFNGVPQISQVSKKTAASTTIKVQTILTYDPAYRLSTVSQSYNGGTSTPVASYSYNELGQVIKKGLGYVNPSTWLQNVDFRYNIRGQLLSINNSKLNSDTGKTNTDTNDLFGMLLVYDFKDMNLGNTPSYDGKLTGVKWMSKDASGNSTYERSYKYYYDLLNRDTASIYSERTVASTGAFFNNIGGFNENGITYDAGGNILTLIRNASNQGTNSHVQIDNLMYTYSATNPNQLQSVSDGTDANHTGAGFTNITTSTGNYTYDGTNGNLTADPYKGIVIAYNVLNKTDKITFPAIPNRWIDYTYNSNGSLIRKRQYDNINGLLKLQNTTDYVDGFVFVNNSLSYFPMPEGRVLNISGSLIQEFVITDQQGNARLSFQNNGGVASVKQENSYYAFGLIMPGSPVNVIGTPNKQLYNGGSEWQNDYTNLPDYQQTFFRNYDAAIGRWVAVDPEAENAESLSTYQYVGNNPIMFNDPLGNLNEQGTVGFLRSWGDPGLNGNNYSNNSGLTEADAEAFAASGQVPSNESSAGQDVTQESDATLISQSQNGDVPALQEYARRYGKTYNPVWNPNGGAEITEEEWAAAGGNKDEVDPNKQAVFFAGAWMLKQKTDIGPKLSFATLMKNYPMPYEPGPYSQDLYFNQCAIRMSIALQKSGVDLSGTKNKTNPGTGPDHKTFTDKGEVLGAYNLAIFLWGYLGKPGVIINGNIWDVPDYLKGQTGIIFFMDFVEDGVRSYNAVHIDLWNGSSIRASETFDQNQMFDAKVIWFWPVK